MNSLNGFKMSLMIFIYLQIFVLLSIVVLVVVVILALLLDRAGDVAEAVLAEVVGGESLNVSLDVALDEDVALDVAVSLDVFAALDILYKLHQM